MWQAAEVSKMAMSMPLWTISSTVETKKPAFNTTASPGSR